MPFHFEINKKLLILLAQNKRSLTQKILRL